MIVANPQGPSCYFQCYTTDPDQAWDYCDVPLCSTLLDTEEKICTGCTLEECGTKRNVQSDYIGMMNTTISGRTCDVWKLIDYAEMAATDFMAPDAFREKNNLFGNYCRNPFYG